MAIKKDIEIGTVLAVRHHYGVHDSYLQYYDYGNHTFKYVLPQTDEFPNFNHYNRPLYHTYALKLKTRRGRTKGAIIPETLVPLMEGMNIKVIPYEHLYTSSGTIQNQRLFIHIQNNYFPGNYEETWKRDVFSLYTPEEGPRQRVDIPSVITSLIPTEYPTRMKYYVAVGTEVYRFHNHNEFEPIEPEPFLQKYEDGIVNADYPNLLETKPFKKSFQIV